MVRNFLFHRVSPERDALWDPMDVALFDRCIAAISSKYQVVLIEDLVRNDELRNTDRLATICFDDGYKDNIVYAAPVLQKYNCAASFYVVTDCIEYNLPTWTHKLEYLFQYTRKMEVDLPFDFLPVEFRKGRFSDKTQRILFVKKLKPFLKTLIHEQRNQVLNKINYDFSDARLPELMMNWNDLRQLQTAGHRIGSHTVTHSMLGTMTNEEEIRFELSQSGTVLEQQLGVFPETISYPVGSYNETTVKLSKEVGYKLGLAVKQILYNPLRDDVFQIPRIELYNEPWWKTRLRISNRLEEVKQFIGYK